MKKNMFVLFYVMTVFGAGVGGVYVGREGIFPYQLVYAIKQAQRYGAILINGREAFVDKVLKNQNAVGNREAEGVRHLESNSLPLRLDSVGLADSGGFPAGGGAIAVIEGNIVVLDRLGGIYRYLDGSLKKIDQPMLPNNLEDFIEKSNIPLDSDSLRTHSLAYDKFNHTVFVCYERYNHKHKSYQFVISSISFDSDVFRLYGSWRTVFEGEERNVAAGQAGGGKLLIEGDKLYFSVGDYGPYEAAKSQDVHSSYGKIYQYGLQNHELKVLSVGHRNTQGLAVTIDHELLNAEHGPQGGDEINKISEGANYGWPYKTYGTDYGSYKWPYARNEVDEKYRLPLFSWVPSIGISSIIQVNNFHENWNADLIVGSLKSQSVFRLKYKESRVIFAEPIWIGHRIRDLLELNGQIYMLTDDSLLIKISVDHDKLKSDIKFPGFVNDARLAKCMLCHHFGPTAPTNSAPSLTGIVGRNIASDSNFNYSPALKAKSGVWNKENLAEFLINPAVFAPGSAMPRLGLSPDEVSLIINKLDR